MPGEGRREHGAQERGGVLRAFEGGLEEGVVGAIGHERGTVAWWREGSLRPLGQVRSKKKSRVQALAEVVHGGTALGRKPDDLAEVVTELALGAPGILAARSLLPTKASALARRRAAAMVAEGFRTLFNQPTALAVVRRLHPEVAYWRATLRYGIDGGLQAVLDEHFHQLGGRCAGRASRRTRRWSRSGGRWGRRRRSRRRG